MRLHVLVLLCFPILMHPIQAQQDRATITVQIIDLKTGKPVTKHPVLAYRIDPPIGEQARGLLDGPPIKGWTDADGKASFFVADLRQKARVDNEISAGETKDITRKRITTTKYADTYIIDASGNIGCSWPEFSLDEILKTGAVGDNRCDKKFDASRYKATPGEVIIFVRNYRWWEGLQD